MGPRRWFFSCQFCIGLRGHRKSRNSSGEHIWFWMRIGERNRFRRHLHPPALSSLFPFLPKRFPRCGWGTPRSSPPRLQHTLADSPIVDMSAQIPTFYGSANFGELPSVVRLHVLVRGLESWVVRHDFHRLGHSLADALLYLADKVLIPIADSNRCSL
jgi:hypothetical protein